MRKNVGNSSGLNIAEIRQAIFKLAHFDPTCKDEYGNQVIDYLVLDSLATYGRLVVTALEIKENIKSVLHLDFQEAEINEATRRLAQKGMLDIVEETRNERPRFQILPEIEAKITNNLSEIKEMDNKVTNDWKEELYSKYKEYPVVRDNITAIVENLHLFMSKMFIRHGVECTALLYPEEKKAQQWLRSIEGNIIEALPQIDPFIDAIVRLEIPSFFKNPDPTRKVYITNLFNSSFFWHLVQVDDECSKLLREVTKGQILYLDNNILYSLIGLHGPVVLQSVHSMLKLAKALGYELAVTTNRTSALWDAKMF